MRTTIRMNETLRRQVMYVAKKERKTFTELVEEAMTELVTKRRVRPRRERINLPVFGNPGKKITAKQLKEAIEEADREYDLKQLEGIPNAALRR